MPIVVQCPHCETKFSVPTDKAGRTIRCPNSDCRQPFKVKTPGRETEPAPLPPEPPAAAPPPKPQKPRSPAKPTVVEPEIVEAAVVTPPKVKEVVWSEGADVPPPKGKKPPRPAREEEPEPDDAPIARRKKKPKNRGPVLLIGMCVAVVALIGAGVFYVINQQGKEEAKQFEQAKQEYKKADYGAAQKTYEKLAAEYPDAENGAEYKFFADLCAMQLVVRAVGSRESPKTAFDRLQAFIEKQKDSALAKHTTGYGRDVLEAGKKLAEDIVNHVDDRVKAFQADRTKSDELKRADDALALGRTLLTMITPFKSPEDTPLDAQRKAFDDVEKRVKREHARTAAINKATVQLEKLSDAMIQIVERDLGESGFLDDPEAQALIAAAKGRLRDMVKFEASEAPPTAAPVSATATALFVAPIGPTRRAPGAGVGDNPAIFLAVARGILYAIDEGSGTLLWAVRIGADVIDAPTVARVALETGPTELALIASNLGGAQKPAIAAYVVKTGEVRWYQELPAPVAGPAVVVGGRAYVALRDPEGSVYEFDLTSGNRKGRIRLGQPVGPALVVRHGTGLLYAAADARRVYVIDAGGKDDDGNRRDPVCVQVIATDHAAGSLRTSPVLLGPDGDAPAERWMILAQTDNRIRAFQLQPIQPPPADGKLPPETPLKPSAELPLDGWVWFPPASDGERLGLVTDRGQFRMFGVNQPGNFDKPLFPYPSPNLSAPPDGTAVRGLVFPAEEAAFWVGANGSLQKYRLALHPMRGMEVVAVGQPMSLGEPTQPPQFTARRDAACLVVRSLNSPACKAVLLNLGDGEIRWQRQLGVVPASTPVPQDGGVVLAAEDGSLIYVPSASGVPAGRLTVAPPVWVAGPPPLNATSPTKVAVSADGKSAFTVTPVLVTEDGKPAAKYFVRRVEGGRVVHEGTVASQGAIAGQPVVLGDMVLIPSSDGFVYRHIAGTGKANPDQIAAGPQWNADRRNDAVCYITPTSATSFLTNDGGKKLSAWDWPKTGRWAPVAATWELRERPAGPGVLLPPAAQGEAARVLFADVTGSLWLFPADRGGAPLKRWQPGEKLPAGEPSSPLVLGTVGDKPVVAYTVKKKFLVCLDPTRDAPRWAVQTGEEQDATLVGPPQQVGAGGWAVTDLGGVVTLFDAEGVKTDSLRIGLPGAVPAKAAALLGDAALLTPLSDGSAVVLPLPPAAVVAPAPKPKG